MNTRKIVAALCFLGLSTLAASSRADELIVPRSVTVDGAYFGDAGFLTDRVIKPRGTYWNDSSVYWGSPSVVTINIDLGAVYSLTGLLVSVDNNDDYVFEGSVDGVTFTEFFRFLAADGPLSPNPGGLELLTTHPAFPSSPTDDGIPAYVGRSFADATYRYLRVKADNGDGFYAIGEIQVAGDAEATVAVPEPASMAMLALGGVAVGLAARRSRRSA